MSRCDVDLAEASDALRGALIFLPDDGSVERFDGGFAMRAPSNPGYWWGNSLRFDSPPADGDFGRWTTLFRDLVHARQPASTHMTFGWEVGQPAIVAPFVAAGFAYFEALSLAMDRGATAVAPHPDRGPVEPLRDGDWTALRRLLVRTQDVPQSEAAYDAFVAGCIDGWRTLEARGQGGWHCIRSDGRIVAALGVFAEARRGPDGRRIGRFQQVVTDPEFRRRGLAGTLVAHASRDAFARLDVDRLLISADADASPRRVYESCGYRMVARHGGLELPDPG